MTNDELTGALSPEDRDTIIEMTSISMGAAASTLAILLGHDVDIVVPDITEHASLEAFPEPFGDEPKSMVSVHYTQGRFASSVFILKNTDAQRLAEMMLGQTGGDPAAGLNELEVSAVGELMNQMMNSAASSMASVLQETVEINNPEVFAYSDENLLGQLPVLLMEPFIAVSLIMKIGTEAPVEMVQLVVLSEARSQVDSLLSIEPPSNPGLGSINEPPAVSGMPALTDFDSPVSQPSQPAMSGAPQRSAPSPQPQHQAAAAQSGGRMDVEPVTVRPVEFTSFDRQPNIFGEENKNLELVMDVTLNLTVELGKTEISIKDVLELTRGSVIELDRVAGEPVDLLANGKLIAKGEVVVIEDNFGLRITSIVSPADRLRGL